MSVFFFMFQVKCVTSYRGGANLFKLDVTLHAVSS